MILGCGIGLAGCYVAYRINNKRSIEVRKDKKIIRQKWQVLMDSMGYMAENKIKQEYELLEIIPKHYGWDAKVSIPPSKKYNDIKAMIPSIESMYKANAMINLAPNKSSAYLRIHNVEKEISPKDGLRFKWFKTFYNIKNACNDYGEIVAINSIEEIKSPIDKEVVGHKIISKIPLGVSYKNIIASHDVISRTLGKCYFDFNADNLELECCIITKPFDDFVRFTPIKVEPYQLFVGMGYDWKPIILDYKESSNWLDGGIINSGKTMAIITGFMNLCICRKDFEMYIANYGEKEDLGVLKNMPQCKCFAGSLVDIIGMLRYLINEMRRRNNLFSKQKEACFNIYQYNKRIKNEENKMKVIHFVSDEIADLVDNETVQDLIWNLVRKGRNCGIYVSLATQRGTLANLSAEIKSNLANKTCFSVANTSSAQTIMGSVENTTDMVMSLKKKREFVVDYIEGIKIGKTLYFDEDMMADYVKKLSEKNHVNKKFDSSGKEIVQNTQENNEKSSKKDKKFENLSKK